MFVFTMDDGSQLQVDSSNINISYGNQIFFNYKNDKFIIDDGFRNNLIRTGYIILNDYDKIQITDKNEGVQIRKNLLEYIYEIMNKMISISDFSSYRVEYVAFKSVKIVFDKNNFRYNIIIDTISSIVTKNQQRMANNIDIYPYIKDIDKFGSVYLSIFAVRINDNDITEDEDKEKYKVSENMISRIINALNDYAVYGNYYHFERLIAKKLTYREGI